MKPVFNELGGCFMKNCLIKLSIMVCILLISTVFMVQMTWAYTQSLSIRLNGEFIDFTEYEAPPMIINGRVLVPLYLLSEKLGFLVEWREFSQTVILSRPENTLMMTLDSYWMMSLGDPFDLDIPAQIINGQIMIPLRAISEATGLYVQWHGDSLMIDIIGVILDREPVPTLQRMIDGIELNISSEDLENILNERGIYFIRSYYSADHDSLGGYAFTYTTENMWIYFNSANILEQMANMSNQYLSTSRGIRVGDSRERVIEIYGNNFRLSPFGPGGMEYFDGETYLSFGFSFGDDTVETWAIGSVSLDENFLWHFGF